MRDGDVRIALHERLRQEHASELDDTLFLDELGLCGEVRVDVAVVNGHLAGYELKSARDTLRRLPAQVETYSRVLDFATLVVADNHVRHAADIVRPWWGLIVATPARVGVRLIQDREPKLNRDVDPMSLAQLLWRDEALEELTIRGFDRGVRSKPRWAVWTRLSESLERDELRDVVRHRLKARDAWRGGGSPSPDGAR